MQIKKILYILICYSEKGWTCPKNEEWETGYMTMAFHSMQYWSAIKIGTAHRINLNTYSETDQNVNHVYRSGKVKWDFSSFCVSQDQIILDLAWALNPNTGVLRKERREIWHTQERPCEDRGREGTYATTDKEPPEAGTGKEGSLARRREWALVIPYFRLLAPTTVRE